MHSTHVKTATTAPTDQNYSQTSPTTVCQSPKSLVAICYLPYVINCEFHDSSVAPLGPAHFLSPDQQSGIHCLIICGIQLLTPNKLGGT